MSEETFHVQEIASRQLETAIRIFLTGKDRYSAITLAGAASGILNQLVRNQGREPFIDFARRVYSDLHGHTPPRIKYSKYLHERLGINELKHFSGNSSEIFALDENQAAEEAISIAITDFVILFGEDAPFVKSFLTWSYLNRDGQRIFEEYQKRPNKLNRR